MKIKEALSADDVLLVPKYSEVKSRSDVDLSVDLGKGFVFKIPLCTANMANVCGKDMAIAISDLGGLALLHRFMDYKEIVQTFAEIVKDKPERINFVGCSVGVHEKDKELATNLFNAGCRIICVDVAHGHSKLCLDMVRWIHDNYPEMLLIAGNVATYDAYVDLAIMYADVIKCGIGSGSICSTRIQTGNGKPQLTALSDIYERTIVTYPNGNRPKIIADGGVRKSGDATKYLCFSDMVMLGNVLAGTDEAPGKTIIIDGVAHKTYAGSSTHKLNHIEGVVGLVPSKGPVKAVVQTFLEGIRSGLSYQGVDNLVDLKKDPEFVRITNAGLTESHPHSIKIVK